MRVLARQFHRPALRTDDELGLGLASDFFDRDAGGDFGQDQLAVDKAEESLFRGNGAYLPGRLKCPRTVGAAPGYALRVTDSAKESTNYPTPFLHNLTHTT